jgi:pimeloyl-ACP methyl ester carboxylesterase
MEGPGMTTKAFRLIVCCAVIVAALQPGPLMIAQEATPAGDASFQPAACMVVLPAGFTEGENASCGYLTVPLKHAEPTGPTINLAVVRLKSTSSNPAAEPLVVLNGGPGEEMETWPLPLFGPTGYFSLSAFLKYQDVIIFDQRGAGASQPSLTCPVSRDATPEPQTAEGVIQCMEDWQASGVDLTAFRTDESAADVESLRAAIGAGQIDLLGASYGTRLALEVMRLYPQGIHRVVLSSPLPPQVDPFAGQLIGFDGALTAMFADCEATPECHAAFPDLNADLQTAFDRLNTNPVTVNYSSESGVVPGLFDGPSFVMLLYVLTYGGFSSNLPAFIHEVADGSDSDLQAWIDGTRTINGGISIADFYAVTCQDEAPFTDRATASAAAEAAGVRPMFLNKKVQNSLWIGILGICDAIGLPAAPPAENEPVHSDIPTLIMTGEYDPITPPSYGELLGEDLSNAIVVEVPGQSHPQLSSGGPCTVGIATSFLADANTAINAGCLSTLPQYFVTQTT